MIITTVGMFACAVGMVIVVMAELIYRTDDECPLAMITLFLAVGLFVFGGIHESRKYKMERMKSNEMVLNQMDRYEKNKMKKIYEVDNKWKKEAVEKGYAEYVIVDPMTGKTKWQWKE